MSCLIFINFWHIVYLSVSSTQYKLWEGRDYVCLIYRGISTLQRHSRCPSKYFLSVSFSAGKIRACLFPQYEAVMPQHIWWKPKLLPRYFVLFCSSVISQSSTALCHPVKMSALQAAGLSCASGRHERTRGWNCQESHPGGGERIDHAGPWAGELVQRPHHCPLQTVMFRINTGIFCEFLCAPAGL